MRFLDSFTFDAVSSNKTAYTDNDFEVVISEADWLDEPIEYGHYLFELDSEWGGRVEGINHVGSEIKLTGPTWRGMLARKIVKPSNGYAYKTITNQEANAAILSLLGASMGTLFAVSTVASGIYVTGSYRYDNLLDAIYTTLDDSDARLNIVFDGSVVTLSAVVVVDLSDTMTVSQDYTAPIQSAIDYSQAYNHVIALGKGDMAARTVVEYYRSATGVISATALLAGIDDVQYLLDYPNAADTATLQAAAIKKLQEFVPVTKVEIDLTDVTGLNLGDIVGGRDQITGLVISEPITQIIRKVDQFGDTYQYKVGE